MGSCCEQRSESVKKGVSLLDNGCGLFGCSHYRRRCKVRAPCCNEIFDCRHCHNEAKNSFEADPRERHEIPRHLVEKVICSLCGLEQNVQQNCEGCGVCMGKYFCGKCKFLDDDVSKNQYHCDGCGICRTGGGENFFHCFRCGCCYSNTLKNSHQCVERAMHHNCPICFEYLFDSVKKISVLTCGHTLHLDCLKEMELHLKFACPVCSKSVCDMSRVWEKLDQEVAATPMPEMYQNKMIWILCNDCGAKSEVQFHVVGSKCLTCSSYNTRQTRVSKSHRRMWIRRSGKRVLANRTNQIRHYESKVFLGALDLCLCSLLGFCMSWTGWISLYRVSTFSSLQISPKKAVFEI